jgi:hypothetical protein
MIRTYALVKDGVVVNSVVADEMTTDLENSLHEIWETTECLLVETQDEWFVAVGTLWNGTNFIPVSGSPFPSWIWDVDIKLLKAPVNPPITPGNFTWNESMLDWVSVD